MRMLACCVVSRGSSIVRNSGGTLIRGGHSETTLLEEGERKLSNTLIRLALKLRLSPVQFLFGFSIIVGLVSGLGAFVFKQLIALVDDFCFLNPEGVPALGKFLILVPALGGAVVGPLTYFFAKEIKGGGVPETMIAVHLKGGRIRPIVAFIKTIASALTIGTGGSAGSEGPIVQIGAGFGSTVGQLFRMPPKRIKTLVACGAAGGISAIFNAPFAGVMFALEVILGEFGSLSFIYVVLSSMTAAALSRALTGDVPVFDLPSFRMISHWEILAYFGLGVATAFTAKLFVFLLVRAESLYNRMKVPDYLKPITGGLVMGLIAYFTSTLIHGSRLGSPLACMGVGYETISEVMDKAIYLSPVLVPLVLLLFLKIFATCFTLGSGGSGGMFAPSLFIGAMTGGIYGMGIGYLFPGLTASPAVYALVGMGACFAGTALAPISAIFLLYEMTNQYQIVIPIMAAVSVSFLVSRWMKPESIYEERLLRRGIDLKAPSKVDFLKSLIIKQIMIKDVQVIPDTMKLSELAPKIGKELHTSLPVVDGAGELVGIVTSREIHPAMASDIPNDEIEVKDFMVPDPVVAYPGETAAEVFQRMTEAYVGVAPVIRRYGPRKVIGLITYRHVFAAYQRALKE
jgi:chloride channel protein, CIC family